MAVPKAAAGATARAIGAPRRRRGRGLLRVLLRLVLLAIALGVVWASWQVSYGFTVEDMQPAINELVARFIYGREVAADVIDPS